MRRALSVLSVLVLSALLLTSCGLFGTNGDDPPPPNGDTQVDPSGTSTTLRVAVIGDWGSGFSSQYAVAQRMCRWRKQRPFDMVLTTGDNIYPDGDPSRFENKFFTPMACLLDNGVEFHATLGNHDILTRQGRPQINNDSFGMSGRNYVLRVNGVRFVMADSNPPMDMDWLRRATRAQSGDRWTVVVFHHPVYSPSHQHGPSSWLKNVSELFVDRGVDLVLNGHDHLYAVTKPLRRIRYVVTGGGGASLYDCAPAWYRDTCREKHHFLYVIANEERIAVRAVGTSGPPFDAFSTTGR